MSTEAVVLTGGSSSRMGTDKAKLSVEGRPQAEHVLWALTEAGCHVTVLGKEAIGNHAFLADLQEYQGPLSALGSFQPRQELVFVCSCDMPLFDQRLVDLFRCAMSDQDVCLPVVDGYRQPLCGLYKASVFAAMRDFDGQSMLDFLKTMSVYEISENELTRGGVSALAVRSANTRDELKILMLEYAESN